MSLGLTGPLCGLKTLHGNVCSSGAVYEETFSSSSSVDFQRASQTNIQRTLILFGVLQTVFTDQGVARLQTTQIWCTYQFLIYINNPSQKHL
jgi:hypothetical protein